jgi:hypothetical protein
MKQMQIMYKTCENDVKVPGHIIFTSFAYYFRFVLTFWGPELGPRSPSSGVPGSGRAQPGTVGPGQFQCFFDVLVGSDTGPTWEHPGATRGNPYSRSNSGKMRTFPRNSGENRKTFGNRGIPRTSKEIQTKIINSAK